MKKIISIMIIVLSLLSCTTFERNKEQKYQYNVYLNKKYNTKFSNGMAYLDEEYKFSKKLYDEINQEYIIATNDFENYILVEDNYMIGLYKSKFIKLKEENGVLELKSQEENSHKKIIKNNEKWIIIDRKKETPLYNKKTKYNLVKSFYNLHNQKMCIYTKDNLNTAIMETPNLVEKLRRISDDSKIILSSYDGRIVVKYNDIEAEAIFDNKKQILINSKGKNYIKTGKKKMVLIKIYKLNSNKIIMSLGRKSEIFTRKNSETNEYISKDKKSSITLYEKKHSIKFKNSKGYEINLSELRY